MTNWWIHFWPYALTAIVIGMIAEVIANTMRLWVYDRPWRVWINLFVFFGIVMGSLTTLAARRGLIVASLLAAAVGLLYEVVNLRFLHWWSFPDQRMAFVRGHAAILAVLTLLWGFVPPLTWALRLPVERRTGKPTAAERFESLQIRELQLLEKLRALHEREDQIETALEAVRSKKRLLGGKFEVRNPVAVPPTP